MVALVTMWSRGKTLSTLPCESLQFRLRSSGQANARAKPLNIDVIPPKPGMPTPRAALAALEAGLGLTHKSDFCDCRDCSAIG